MNITFIVVRRELSGYFSTPVAYVFIVAFLALLGAMTFFVGNFFERGLADLNAFFQFHPWLYMLLIPAISMRLWAEERKTGTIEMFLTLPISLTQAVIGKYLAAVIFAAIALSLTFPIWITVNVLGNPDNGVILSGYIGSLLMAAGFLAIGSFISALTKNQVIAFVVTACLSFVFIASGAPVVLNFFSGWAPQQAVDFIASLSFLTHFTDISKGVLDITDLAYFASLISVFLFATALAVARLKGE
ncbi:MAG: ABC-2 type transport system permease protein [Alphaproteobacteria bacterium]|jgi:ABC-2 type transport system permease protein